MSKKKGKDFKNKNHFLQGKLDVTRSGIGYVIVEGVEKDIFIRQNDFNKAFHGDTVRVSIKENNGKRTEGISKAWISNIVNKDETATAIGTYSGLQSICALIASSLTGFLWYSFGPIITFSITAAVTLIVIVYLVQFHRPIIKN